MARKATGTPFRRRVAWTAGDGIIKASKLVKRVGGVISDAEERILDRIRSPQRRLHFDLEVSQDGITVRNTAEKKSFRVFDLEKLPWDYEKPKNNYNLLVELLNDRSLATIEVFSKPSKEAVANVRQYIENKIEKSRERGLATPMWEKDLRALADYIDEQRTEHICHGVYCLDEMESEGLSDVFANAQIPLLKAAYFIFGLLSGFWNEKFFKELVDEWEKRRKQARQNGSWTPEWDSQWMREEVTHFIIPDVIDRSNPRLPTLIGEAGRLYSAAFEITSLGLSTIKEEDSGDEDSLEITIANTGSWLSKIVFDEVEEVGDTIIVATTYYSTGEKLSEPWQKRREASFQPHSLLKKQEKQVRADKQAYEQSQEQGKEVQPAQHLDQAKSNYLTLWRTLLDELEYARDRLVRVHYTVIAQAPDERRAEKLAENVDTILTRKDVLFRRTESQQAYLKALRTCLPVVLKDNTEEEISPLSVDYAAVSIVPPEEEKLPEERLKIPLGEDEHGNLFEWVFGDPFAVWARQRTGKTTMLMLLILRYSGFLPLAINGKPGSVMWVYDGTDALAPPEPRPFGWPAITRALNTNMDRAYLERNLPEHLRRGLVYAQNYKGLSQKEAAGKLRGDLLGLCEAGARLIVFRAYERIHQLNSLDFGMFDAANDYRRYLSTYEVPSVFYVDETAHFDPLRLKRIFRDHVQDSTKYSEELGVTGHSVTYIPDYPEDIRTPAEANLTRKVLGPINLHRKLMEEADIDPEQKKQEARFLSQMMSALTLKNEPGSFVLTEAGGGRIKPFWIRAKDLNTLNLIRRKSAEAAKEFGL